MFGITCHIAERFSNRAEQEVVERLLILQHKCVQLVRQRENDVEVTRLKQFLAASVHPTLACLRLALVAMPIAAAVVGDDWRFLTIRTNIGMTAERCGAAPRDGPDDLELLNSQSVLIHEVVALCAEDIGHLDGGPVHSPFFLRRLGFAPSPEMGRASTGL